MNRRFALVSLAVALLATASLGAGPDFAALGIQRYDPPKPAPTFELPDLNGRTVRLADLRGKVVLLFFWTTWCPDCREELPSVNKLYTDLRKKGFEVLLINFREPPELVKRTVKERGGYTAPVLIDGSGEVTGARYGVWGPPTAYFVDRRGQLVGRVVGPRDWSTPAARAFVQALLDAGAKR